MANNIVGSGGSEQITWKKWQVCMHGLGSDDGDVKDPTYSKEVQLSTQVVKMLNQNEIFWLIIAFGVLFINSVTLYACDSADVMDDDNFATVLGCFVSTSSLWVAQGNTKKVEGLDHLVLAKKWGISPKKALHMNPCSTQCGVCRVKVKWLSVTVQKTVMCTVIYCLHV